MRTLIVLSLAAAALAACEKAPPAPSASISPAATTAAVSPMAGIDHAGMSMPDMAASGAADAASTAETPDGHQFHVLHLTDVQSVHLPVAAAGGAWTAVVSDPSLVSVDGGADEKMPDGTMHHVVKVTPKVSGNADVKFERRATAKTTDPVLETRTMHFMVH